MKNFLILLAGAFFWMGCAKDLLEYPLLDTQLKLFSPDSIYLETNLKNLSAGMEIIEAGYIWSFSAQTPSHAGGFDSAYVLRQPDISGVFSMAKGGLPLNTAIYFRGYVLIGERDTLYGQPRRVKTGKIDISINSVGFTDAGLTVVTTISGLPVNGTVSYGYLWVTVPEFMPEIPLTLTTIPVYQGGGVAQWGWADSVPNQNLIGLLTETLQIDENNDLLVRAFIFYDKDTIYSNLLEAHNGNFYQRTSDFPGEPIWGAVSFSDGWEYAYMGTGEVLPSDLTPKNQGIPTQAFWMYGKHSNEWTQMPPFPGVPRYNAVAFVIDGKAYVGGGRDHTQTFQDFYVFDMATWAWDTIASYPIKVAGAAAFAINGRGYVCTGAVCANDFLSYGLPNCDAFEASTYEYRPDENKWYRKADLPDGVLPRVFAVGFSIGSKGYVGTGLTPNYFSFGFYEFDPSVGDVGQWTRKANFGDPVNGPPRLGAVGFSIGNYGYIGTGSTYNLPTYNDLWRYDPAKDQWTPKANVGNLNREFSTAFVLEDKAYIGLGFVRDNQNRASREFWKYYPD